MRTWCLKSKEMSRVVALLTALAATTGCGDDDKSSTPAYYLRGRAYDAVSLEGVTAAELTLLTGASSLRAKSDKDGTFTLGPIAPGASYRVSVRATDMMPFEFTGLGLAAIDGEEDRTVIADTPLFPEGNSTPAFHISLDSASKVMASARFTPMAAGRDPSREDTEDGEQSPDVSGNYVQNVRNTLPNAANASAPSYRVSFVDGKAEVSEDALRWGTTYKVEIDAGPSYDPVSFVLTPVKDADIQVRLRRAAVVETEDGALANGAQQYFTGRVYDGVSMTRLTDYNMRLEYYDRVLPATVGEDGRYVVGPLLPNADYSIVIESKGYRSFLSHNAKSTASGTTASLTSLYFDAFLYPESVKAPAATCRFSLRNDNTLPSGTVRFAPRSGSSLFNEADETPAGIAGQVWGNDEDLQQRTVVKTFSNGELKLAEGELTLGVTYEVSIYGVANYALLDNATFRPGVDVNPTFVLSSLTESALQVVAISTQGAKLSPDARVEIRFNQNIARYPLTAESTVLRALNDGFDIVSPNLDADPDQNLLVDSSTLTAPISPTYRGVSFEISGDRLILKWNKTSALRTTDAGDPITGVVYGGLGALSLYTATLQSSPPVSLSSLIGNTLDVQLLAL